MPDSKSDSQWIILKADDLIYDSVHTLPAGFNKFIEYISRKQIKASLGIIGRSLETDVTAYFDALQEIHSSGLFEIWNHGYQHLLRGRKVRGEMFDEFQNTSSEYQYDNMLKTQQLAKTKLGITLRTFGAPGNAIDDNTVKAIEQIDEIKVWLFGKPSGKLVLYRYCDIEYPTLKPDYSKFVEHYTTQRDYLVLQVHPKEWSKEDFMEFEKIIDFLLTKDVAFITPYDFYLRR
ncbi:polysaccharide deacetylase family protein [Paenibacillus sp. KQZ6P-2]|uniref:Polysaccharide deacetylase family protein n=1 Tax=Paenibacillus mangrovi TaxID=2931978 RepID=A0A9X1WTX7_9BACL|nr:DUF2334 domain-containing protein [Paenibacillus mangrovi]MCJ8013528.1 polysaccharide deacetylase family protein [Paenibacillus mangrovi]